MPSQITLNNLLLLVSLGWPSEERAEQQQVSVNLTLTFDSPPKACQTDLLDDTVCYHGLTDALKNGVRNKKFRLIEHLTHELYHLSKQFLPPQVSIFIHVTKKPAIADLIDGVSFSYGEMA